MRTDAKIGFAIGGVLLAVLTVYAIVVPKHSRKSSVTVSMVTPVSPVNPSQSSASDTPATPTVNPPPIAAAEGSTTSSKEVATPPVTTSTPIIPGLTPPMVDNSSPPADGFHPLPDSKEMPKSDEKTGKLVDGVYTPDGAVPTRHRKSSRTVTPMPDDSTEASTTGDRQYVIKPGQTLSKIAYEVYGNSRFWVAIQRENKGLDANHMKVGSKINLPDITPLQPGPITVSDEEVAAPTPAHHAVVTPGDAHSYTVKSGDSLYGIAKRLLGSGRKADALYALNKDVIGPDKSRLKLGMVLKLPQGA